MSRLDIRTLGSLAVLLEGRRLELGTLKQRALLSLLLINRGRTVPVERIVIALWGPDAPPNRRSDVWVYVSRLRKALGPAGDLVTRIDGGYMLNVADEALDASRFESLAEEGRGLMDSDPPAASLVLGEALALWRGDAYSEFATEDFALAEVARLEEARLTTLEKRIQADLAWVDADALLPEIESLVRAHPLRPSFTGHLMLALYRRGRQAEALRAYAAFAERLGEDAGLKPPEGLQALEERILMDDPAVAPASPALPVRLPEPIASFVGRATEVVELAELLKNHRLVLLTGPGGVGKTTLALEGARRVALEYDDAAFVDLTMAEGLHDVMPVVANALKVRAGASGAQDAMLSRLGRRRVLMVFDNCEVAAARTAEAISALLEQAPGVRVLATSRTTLGIPGEQVVRLAPMGTEPNGDGHDLLRARIASLPGPTADNVSANELQAIVDLTEGLPLAIELAAAQLSTWSAEEIINALDSPLDTLVQPERVGPERHREMRTSIAWSERFLPAPASELLGRLSVFRSGFAFKAVGPVAGFGSLADGGERQQLRRLVESSLVLVESGQATRYRLLEPVRDYAKLRLADAGDFDIVAERHARFYLHRLRQLGRDARQVPGDELRVVHADIGNLLAAIRWAIEAGEEEEAQRAAARAIPILRIWGDFADTLALVEEALAVSDTASKARAELLFASTPIWGLVRGADAWRERVAALRALADTLDDPEVTALATLRQADMEARSETRPAAAEKLYQQAAAALRELGSPYVPWALHQWAWFLLNQGEWREAHVVAEEWLATTQAHGWSYEELDAREFGVWLALTTGDHAGLEAEAHELAAGYRRHGDHRSAAALTSLLAIGSLQRGDAAEALRRIDVGRRANLETGVASWVANNTATRACIKLAIGDHSGAAADALAAMGRNEQTGNLLGLDASLTQIAVRAAATPEPATAATILGAVDHVFDPAAADFVHARLVLPALDTMIGDPERALRATLGGAAFDEAWKKGAALDQPAVTRLVRESLRRLAAEAEV